MPSLLMKSLLFHKHLGGRRGGNFSPPSPTPGKNLELRDLKPVSWSQEQRVAELGLIVCDITHCNMKNHSSGTPTKLAGLSQVQACALTDGSPLGAVAGGGGVWWWWGSQLSPVVARNLLCHGPRCGERRVSEVAKTPRW